MVDPAREQPPEPLEEEQQPDKRSPADRSPARWRDVAEEAIEEAIRSGAFDDLPGRGKPLNLINNPYAPGTELAYQLLKDNQYTLPWISERAAVLAAIQDLRDEISTAWITCQGGYRKAGDDSRKLELTQEWHELLLVWETSIASLNKDIATLNLKQPGGRLEIVKLSLGSELERAGARLALG
jgi:DnaJ family protein C protein 28